VSSCGKRTKRTEQKKLAADTTANPSNEGTPDAEGKVSQSPSTEQPPKKRKREERDSKSNPAMRRMQMKKAIQQIVKKNAQNNLKKNNSKKKAKTVSVMKVVKKLTKMNQKK
jgi:hypothetical protein